MDGDTYDNCTIGSILLHSFLLIYRPYPPSFHEMIFTLVYIGMQEWLLIYSIQEWLVVGHAGVARRWPCRSGSSLAMQEWLVYYIYRHAGVAIILVIPHQTYMLNISA